MRPQVRFSDGIQRECLVPLASLLNHSGDAHIKQYGTVTASTARLSLRLSRPCAGGEQLFLSYGPLSNLALLLFYGFALPENPNETASITLEVLHCLRYIKFDDMAAHRSRHIACSFGAGRAGAGR